MITYPNNNVQSVPDYQTGRIFVIADATALTPAVFYKFISEGFVPVATTVDDGVATNEFCAYSTVIEGAEAYTITVGEVTYTSAGWDTPYAVSE